VPNPGITKHLSPDTPVIVAFMIDGRPMAVNGLCVGEQPLKIFTKDPRTQDISYPQSVVLVWHREESVLKGEADAVSVEPHKAGFLLTIDRTHVAEVDRRVYARYPVEVPVSIRSVCDMKESHVIALSQGVTKDISLGGAWVDVQPVVAMGSIVEFHIKVDGEEMSALAMVAHDNPNRGGNGLEFIDFYGDSRDKFLKFLERATKAA
jgi:hypothetical protein